MNEANLQLAINERLKHINKASIGERIEAIQERVNVFSESSLFELRISVVYIWNTKFNSDFDHDMTYEYDDEYSFLGTYEEWKEHLKEYDFVARADNVLAEKIEISNGTVGYSVINLRDNDQ